MWAKRLVRHAEDHNKLGEEQGGSRPDAPLLTLLVKHYLSIPVRRKPVSVLSDNDAKSVTIESSPSLALIASRALGMSVACRIHGQALTK
jgi:hypothetical protein